MRVLIAEDEATSGRLLQRIIEPFAKSDLVSDGNQAVAAYLRSTEEGAPYDLIFLDIMMPLKSGQQALNEIRDFEQERGIPLDKAAKVIMTTALDDEENVFEAHVSGCCAYLVKPIDRKKVIEEVRALGFSIE